MIVLNENNSRQLSIIIHNTNYSLKKKKYHNNRVSVCLNLQRANVQVFQFNFVAPLREKKRFKNPMCIHVCVLFG